MREQAPIMSLLGKHASFNFHGFKMPQCCLGWVSAAVSGLLVTNASRNTSKSSASQIISTEEVFNTSRTQVAVFLIKCKVEKEYLVPSARLFDLWSRGDV